MKNKGKIVAILFAFVCLGLLTGVIIEQYIEQEVAIQMKNNRPQNYILDMDAYQK